MGTARLAMQGSLSLTTLTSQFNNILNWLFINRGKGRAQSLGHLGVSDLKTCSADLDWRTEAPQRETRSLSAGHEQLCNFAMSVREGPSLGSAVDKPLNHLSSKLADRDVSRMPQCQSQLDTLGQAACSRSRILYQNNGPHEDLAGFVGDIHFVLQQ